MTSSPTTSVTISSCRVTTSKANRHGGLMYVKATSSVSVPIILTYSSATHSSPPTTPPLNNDLDNLEATTGDGGAFYLDGDSVSLTIRQTTAIDNSKSLLGHGGLIHSN